MFGYKFPVIFNKIQNVNEIKDYFKSIIKNKSNYLILETYSISDIIFVNKPVFYLLLILHTMKFFKLHQRTSLI